MKGLVDVFRLVLVDAVVDERAVNGQRKEGQLGQQQSAGDLKEHEITRREGERAVEGKRKGQHRRVDAPDVEPRAVANVELARHIWATKMLHEKPKDHAVHKG